MNEVRGGIVKERRLAPDWEDTSCSLTYSQCGFLSPIGSGMNYDSSQTGLSIVVQCNELLAQIFAP